MNAQAKSELNIMTLLLPERYKSSANSGNIIEKTLEYINSKEAKLSLDLPSNIMNDEKREMLRNLLESEIPEEMIAERLDLDMQTVKKLIQEMRK
jgi:hypothetical protein